MGSWPLTGCFGKCDLALQESHSSELIMGGHSGVVFLGSSSPSDSLLKGTDPPHIFTAITYRLTYQRQGSLCADGHIQEAWKKK